MEVKLVDRFLLQLKIFLKPFYLWWSLDSECFSGFIYTRVNVLCNLTYKEKTDVNKCIQSYVFPGDNLRYYCLTQLKKKKITINPAMVTRNKSLSRKFYYSIIKCSHVVNLCTTLTIHNKPLFVEIISKCNWLIFGPGYIHYPLNPRIYYFLRAWRTTNELSVFIFVANIIHLAKVNSLPPFQTYQIPYGSLG